MTARILGFDGRTTTVAGVRLHYWIGGERTGKPAILWHGMVAMVAEDVEAHTLAGCGHFMIEERPQFVIDQILKLSARLLKRSKEKEIAP
jgi:hypothetical protein